VGTLLNRHAKPFPVAQLDPLALALRRSAAAEHSLQVLPARFAGRNHAHIAFRQVNGNEYAKAMAARAGIGFTALDNGFAAVDDVAAVQAICDGFDEHVIAGLTGKWMALLPCPFTAADAAAGYRYDISVLQAEFSLTQVLDKPVTGRIFFEQAIRDNLDLGRPDRVGLIFGRRIIRKGPRATPGRFRTRVITDGVIPTLHVDYKHSKMNIGQFSSSLPNAEACHLLSADQQNAVAGLPPGSVNRWLPESTTSRGMQLSVCTWSDSGNNQGAAVELACGPNIAPALSLMSQVGSPFTVDGQTVAIYAMSNGSVASRIKRPVPVTVNDVLDGHVKLTVDCLDRLYLHGYLGQLQVSGQLVQFLRHRRYPIPSAACARGLTGAA
jgi:hypothetical protein